MLDVVKVVIRGEMPEKCNDLVVFLHSRLLFRAAKTNRKM
jgi:F0F1-type ATP synthase alpha subunit